jgi:hypothetical protein
MRRIWLKLLHLDGMPAWHFDCPLFLNGVDLFAEFEHLLE